MFLSYILHNFKCLNITMPYSAVRKMAAVSFQFRAWSSSTGKSNVRARYSVDIMRNPPFINKIRHTMCYFELIK